MVFLLDGLRGSGGLSLPPVGRGRTSGHGDWIHSARYKSKQNANFHRLHLTAIFLRLFADFAYFLLPVIQRRKRKKQCIAPNVS
ncbi:hypothetical protein, partial [Intestinimonas timonensis]|uniref:hypothetical protein n=1 Tax=Intestinimonas timonensis TaxID=1689270 RepID=UPI003A8E5F72